MGRAYLDHASTSPLRPEARTAMVQAIDSLVGDPGRIHEEGMASRVALETAREQVAVLFGARSREVVFTSSATESIATAVQGAVARARGRADDPATVIHQVVTAVEHSAVRHAVERSGSVTVVPVDGSGRVDVDAVLDGVGPDTAVVHIQWGNHEVGTVQPVAEVVAACRERGVLVHVDAAQAAGRVPIDFVKLGADLMSISGHKLGGPAGTGVLLVRRGLRIPPLLLGGDQERARRAGLEPVPALVGLGAACAALANTLVADEVGTDESGRLDRTEGRDGAGPGVEGRDRVVTDDGEVRSSGVQTVLAIEARRAVEQTDRLRAGLTSLDGITAFGDPVLRLPHLVCLGIEGIEPQGVLLGLDRAGIAAHSGSACSSESLEPSPVLEAMGVDAHRSLRLSVGWSTTDADIDLVLATLPDVVDRLRALATT